MDRSLRVVDIVDGTTVDGPGFRTSIYFAGCDHHCPGCHNASTWSHSAGADMTIENLISRIEENDFDVTFSGGDPLCQIDSLIQLAIELKKRGRNIWCYTGYTFEEIVASDRLSKILDYVDVIVDGRFVESRKDTALIFRGSSNQRLIDVGSWRDSGQLTLWESDF